MLVLVPVLHLRFCLCACACVYVIATSSIVSSYGLSLSDTQTRIRWKVLKSSTVTF